MTKTIKQSSIDRVFYKNLKSFSRKLDNLIFPIFTHEIIYFLTLWTILDALEMNFLNFTTFFIKSSSIFISLLTGTFVAFITISIIRTILTIIAYYKGWLFEEIGKAPSNSTKLFMLIWTNISKRASFFSYQGLLPWLLVPRIDDTLEKYLETMKPILNENEYEELVDQSNDFRNTVASGLQNKLWMKWAFSKNYISDWWKEAVYMRYRDSLIRSNVGCADIIYEKTTNIQAARAAYVTLNRQNFVKDIFDRNKMKPITIGGIPLCAQQYADYHRTLRVPHETADKMIHLPDARHIAVFHRGCWYKVDIYHGRRMIRPAELERAFQMIIDKADDEASVKGEKLLASLTMGPRDLWARVRREKFSDDLNYESLSLIENSLEIVFLDEEEQEYDENDPKKYGREYARALHGDGYMLWCDKPSVYIFSKNGRFLSNAEHSPCDAMIYVQVREYVKYHEHYEAPYGSDGHCHGSVEFIPTPTRIRWNFDEETLSAIDEAYKFSKSVADDFSNSNIIFTDYGKNFMKKAKVSPDAYIQMALQMAYYKDQGKFEQTYEPAVMRLFKEGRTETVRSCSIESCDFVRSMLDKNVDNMKKLENLKIACSRHQNYYRNAMAGRGVDRHLFALYVVSRYYSIASPFLENVFNRSWALSTSQTPQHQMIEYSKALNNEPSLFWPAGGFTCPDGSNYGVCYTIGTTGDRISFHITTWKSLKNTDAERFLKYLIESLKEMKQMVEDATSSNKTN